MVITANEIDLCLCPTFRTFLEFFVVDSLKASILDFWLDLHFNPTAKALACLHLTQSIHFSLDNLNVNVLFESRWSFLVSYASFFFFFGQCNRYCVLSFLFGCVWKLGRRWRWFKPAAECWFNEAIHNTNYSQLWLRLKPFYWVIKPSMVTWSSYFLYYFTWYQFTRCFGFLLF